MKRICIVIFTVLAFAAASAAHPPSAINITSDLKTMTLKVDAVHQVKNPKDHYIHEITVRVNGKKLISQDATEQITAEKQSMLYVVPGLKAGDKISVTADCNKMGDLTVEYTAQSEPVKARPQETKRPVSKPEANASSKFKVK